MRALSFFLIPIFLPASLALAADVDSTTSNELSARGVLEASQTARIAAPMAARLTGVPFRDGVWFKSGATLATFDCTAMEAELAALRDAHTTLTLRHENQAELFAVGAAGELEVKLAKSEAAQAASEARAIEARLKDCTLLAPWSGTVIERHMQAHETPAVGEPIYSIVRSGRSELVIIAPSAWSKWAKAGVPFTFVIDETGERVPAKISRMGAVVDAASQTIEISARLTGKTKARPGMSGTAQFAPTDAPN